MRSAPCPEWSSTCPEYLPCISKEERCRCTVQGPVQEVAQLLLTKTLDDTGQAATGSHIQRMRSISSNWRRGPFHVKRTPCQMLNAQLSEPGAKTSIMRLRSSTLANSILTRPFRAPKEIFTLVSRRSESDEAR